MSSPRRRLLGIVLLLAAALGLRLLCAVRTVAPDRDCANYLQSAEAIAHGDVETALRSVFPPLHPAVLALPVRLAGAAPEAQWWAAILTTLLLDLGTLVLLVRLGERWLPPGPVRWLPAAWFAFAMLPAWQVADGMSEPLFRLLFCTWLLGWAAGDAWRILLVPALMFWTRPEAAVLFLPALLHVHRHRDLCHYVSGAAGLLLALAYPLARYAATGDFALLPKAGFMAHLSAAASGEFVAGLRHYGRELGRFAGQGFDGLGYAAYPLFFLGLAPWWRRREGRAPLLAVLVALLVVPGLFAHRRFWTPWLPLLLLVAASALRWPEPRRAQRLLAALLILLALPHAVRLCFERREALRADLAFARWLRVAHPEPAAVASDLQRLLFFAGQPAPPPRSIEAEDLREQLVRPSTRIYVTLERRGKLESAELRALGFRPLSLPLDAAKWNASRGLTAWSR